MQTIIYTYGGYHKVCTVMPSDRKTLSITVTPRMDIVIKIPIDCAYETLQALLQKRQHWIYKQLRHFEKFNPLTPPRQYVSGETHLYLGRQYRLKVLPQDTQPVKLKDGYFWVPADMSQQVEKKLHAWYLKQAKQKFVERLDICLQHHPYFHPPTLHIRRMKTRWGALSKNNVMTLNTLLIKASVDCIDYVIIHELCHQYHMHHGKDFWQFLSMIYPHWQATKNKLEHTLS